MKKIKDDMIAKNKNKAQAKDSKKSAKPADNLAPKAKNLPKNVEGKGKIQSKGKMGDKQAISIEYSDLKGKKKQKK